MFMWVQAGLEGLKVEFGGFDEFRGVRRCSGVLRGV